MKLQSNCARGNNEMKLPTNLTSLGRKPIAGASLLAKIFDKFASKLAPTGRGFSNGQFGLILKKQSAVLQFMQGALAHQSGRCASAPCMLAIIAGVFASKLAPTHGRIPHGIPGLTLHRTCPI
jgi:hypothetical protein